jgi:hypothetical protein
MQIFLQFLFDNAKVDGKDSLIQLIFTYSDSKVILQKSIQYIADHKINSKIRMRLANNILLLLKHG